MIRNVAIAVKTFPGVRGSPIKTQRPKVAVETARGESHKKKMFMANTYMNFVNQLRSEARASSIFLWNVSSHACFRVSEICQRIRGLEMASSARKF